MNKSAIVLAGGFSSRFGQDKGVIELANKPLIQHVVDSISPIVDEIIVVTNSEEGSMKYAKSLKLEINFAVDISKLRSPLIGALTGFGAAQGEYSLLLPFDTPFVSREVVLLLFELCVTKAAVVPKWPNGYIEPLHAVYKTKYALKAAKMAVAQGKLKVSAMIKKLRGVRYVSTLVIQQLDPELRTFFNVNTPEDLKNAEAMLKSKKG